MPFRVHNEKTSAVYTVGVVSDDEVVLDGVEAESDGRFLPPAYGDAAQAEVASAKSSPKSNSKKEG